MKDLFWASDRNTKSDLIYNLTENGLRHASDIVRLNISSVTYIEVMDLEWAIANMGDFNPFYQKMQQNIATLATMCIQV